MENILNEKIFLESTNGVIEGILISLDSQNKSFTLNKIIHYPSGKTQDEPQCYKENDIKWILKYKNNNMEICQEDVENGRKNTDTFYSPEIVRNIVHIQNEEFTADEYDILINMAQNSIYIDSVNSNFYNAIKALESEIEIGIDAKGIGFENNIKILNISMSNCVYHFDVLKLGLQGFSQGLQSILEGNVIKVIHDCRHISYWLNKLYLVNLKNVFDTAVGELIITKNVGGEFPRARVTGIRSLPVCLKIFLGIPPQLVWFGIHNKSIWAEYPLSHSLKFSAARDAVFLLPLKNRLLGTMLSPLYQGIDNFLNLVRNSTEDEAIEHIGTDYLVPTKMEDLEIYKLTKNFAF
ncbi:hypothetical protein L9F63_004941 [Diploptera punctata]|uniref:3'-5' exonuclease domain-containing protein n=1 Tax=Diploptera punctata TaxID=6984 RepID=A0AAD7ZER9_DIPPU|nr:hypothetical protein L9F63_004941 [Diploptera punctata]